MRTKTVLLFLLTNIIVFVDSIAQKIPLLYSVVNSGTNCPVPVFPAFSDLQSVDHLPEPFVWINGSGRSTSFKDWKCRRADHNYDIIKILLK